MQWASAVSTEREITAAVAELKRELARKTGNATADLVTAFVTPHYEDDLGRLPRLIADSFAPKTFIGCTAIGVIGGGRELEDVPGLALTSAVLPGVEITPFHLGPGDLPDLDSGPDRWVEALGVDREPTPHFLMLVDPAGAGGFDPRPLLMGLDYAYADATKVGGLASGLQGNRLFLDGGVHAGGCVGAALQGAVAVDTVVSQGCRAIGEPMTVTGCSGYFLSELDGRSAVEALIDLYHSLGEEDQELLRRALHVGIASTELKEDLGQGDYLIRNVLQLDHEKGTIAVGDKLRTGQTVRFHLRDSDTASEDLTLMLERYRREKQEAAPDGVLLFSCNGRGKAFFGEPDHDSRLFSDAVGEVPLGGFFCGGEIGQVGGSTYLHGYTSAFAIFRSP